MFGYCCYSVKGKFFAEFNRSDKEKAIRCFPRKFVSPSRDYESRVDILLCI